jgi:hypothetical protein
MFLFSLQIGVKCTLEKNSFFRRKIKTTSQDNYCQKIPWQNSNATGGGREIIVHKSSFKF